MPERLPSISVVIFAYNHELYISKAIQSVVNQKYGGILKIYVCDDCSTDSTASTIMEYYNKYRDLIIPIVNKTNMGLNKSFFNVIQTLTSEYIALLGGDDYWIREDKIELQVDMLEKNKDISYVHTEYISYLEESNSFKFHQNSNWKWLVNADSREERLSRMLLNKWTGYPLASSSCMRTSVLQEGLSKFSNFILGDFLSGEGTIMHLSMAFFGGKYGFLPFESTVYTIRKNSLSHMEKKDKQLLFHLRYAELRLCIAEKFQMDLKVSTGIIDQVVKEAIMLGGKKKIREWINGMEIPENIKRKYSHIVYFKWYYYYTKSMLLQILFSIDGKYRK